MAKPTKTKKPVADRSAPPPETHAQTKPGERARPPQHHTTESYGNSDEDARELTER